MNEPRRRRRALSWPAAALPGLVLLGLLSTGGPTAGANQPAPMIEMVIAAWHLASAH